MIYVKLEENPKKQLIRLRMKGHSGQAAEGRDLVCAAASVLTYTAAQAVSYLFADGKLCRKPKIELSKGEAHVLLHPKKDYYDEALYTFYVLQLGYGLLAKNYPENLKLSAFGQT